MGMQPISVLFPYLPIKAHRDRDVARKQMSDIFAKIIENRRAQPAGAAKEEDVLQTFVEARYSEAYGGREMTVDEVTGMLIAALFAGQHTSSITSTWTGLYLFSEKYRSKFLPQVLQEQREIMKEHGEELNYEILSKMDFLHRGMKEALRLHPPLIMLMRYVHEAFDCESADGKTIHVPKGESHPPEPGLSVSRRMLTPPVFFPFARDLRGHHLHVSDFLSQARVGLHQFRDVRSRSLRAREGGGQAEALLFHRIRRRPALLHGRNFCLHAGQGSHECFAEKV